MRRPAAAVLVSGGLDSSVLACELLERGFEVHPLYVRCGFVWERAELLRLRRQLARLRRPGLKPLTVLDAPAAGLLPGHWAVRGRGAPGAESPWSGVYLPGRNLLLLAHGGLYCALRGIPRLAIGVLKGNPFGDAAPSFRRLMERVLRQALGARVRILAPYAGLTKARVAGRARGVDLSLTFSCLSPRGLRACGRCSKCGEAGLAGRRVGRPRR